MKKALLILTLLITPLITISAQTDFTDIMAALTDDAAAKAFDFGSLIPAGTSTADLENTLREEGISDSDITALAPVLTALNGGATPYSLNQAETDLPPGVYAELENSIVELFAAEAAKKFYSGPEGVQLRDQVKTLKKTLGMLSSFGQANAQMSRANPLFGYQGYELFAFSFGITTSIATDNPNSLIDAMISNEGAKNLEKQLKDGNISAGFAMQGFVSNIGINMNWLVENLYLGVVLGYTNLKLDGEGFFVDPISAPVTTTPTSLSDIGFEAGLTSFTLGINANYQLVKPVSVPFLFRWNGLSLGTGVIFNNFTIDAKSDMSGFFTSTDGSPTPPNSYVATFDISNNSITVPLEISTGVKLLSVLNISLGAGLDVQLGGSSVNFNLNSQNPDGLSARLVTATLNEILESENMQFPYSKDYGVNILNPRVNAGVGVGIGPITAIDVNATYFIMSGFTLGVNFIFRL